jgi:nucleoside-diphosphate-sugar epimerase
VLVTGASGLLGRHLLRALGDRYYVYAMARRSPRESGVALRPGIRWVLADLGEPASVSQALADIRGWSGLDHVIHLGGFYDFEYGDHPEYERTNVGGTRTLFEGLVPMNPRHVIYVSSLTVHRFSRSGQPVTEDSPADADFAYAQSKRKGEALARQYSRFFRCSVLRAAAIFTDWCEYAPLYHLLESWLGPGLRGRLLAGRGRAAIPYLHVDDFSALLLRLLEGADALPRHGVYLGSPDGATTQAQFYALAQRYALGEARRPIHAPRAACWAGLAARDLLGRLSGRRPFERPWMARYVDLALRADASRTRRVLGWEPRPRLHVTRRLLFMIENMKSHPHDWRRKNDEASHRTAPERLNFLIYQRMLAIRPMVLQRVAAAVEPSLAAGSGPAVSPAALREALDALYRGLEIAVRIGDRGHLLDSARTLAAASAGGANAEAGLRGLVQTLAQVTGEALETDRALAGLERRIHDLVGLTFQLVGDEMEETLERARDGAGSPGDGWAFLRVLQRAPDPDPAAREHVTPGR